MVNFKIKYQTKIMKILKLDIKQILKLDILSNFNICLISNFDIGALLVEATRSQFIFLLKSSIHPCTSKLKGFSLFLLSMCHI